MTTYKVGYIVGSLSKDSINRILSKALIKLAPPELEMTEIPIGHLPLYNRDLDNDPETIRRALAPERARPSPGPAVTCFRGSW